LNLKEIEIFENQETLEENDLILIVADKEHVVNNVLGNLRNIVAKDLKMYDRDSLAFV
jgi:aspartyl-tRNA synthetase